ncbi:MAG: hypothetical protein CME36_18685 [unclassified Hahellaceae]|nr:hypothetical protein [Hahellaceae bacterium]
MGRQLNSSARKALFLGSKSFGLSIFKTIFEASSHIDWTVLCPSDVGDSRSCYNDYVEFCARHDLKLLLAYSLKEVAIEIDAFAPDVMVVCGYYRILPRNVLDKVPLGVWGIHNSLLPKYRGGSPLVWQIINDEKVIGSSFFKLADGTDDGDILCQVRFQAPRDITISQAGAALEGLWIEKLSAHWARLIAGNAVATPQDHLLASYCAQRTEDDGQINWDMSAREIDCFIRAQAAPYPQAFFDYQGKKVRVVKHGADERLIYGTPGQVFSRTVSGEVIVVCGGSSALRLVEVRTEECTCPAGEVLDSLSIRLKS